VVTNNTAACDDGNPCTQGDACSAGQCLSGTNTCACQADPDCAAFEDGNLCNGTLHCQNNLCEIDPATVVSCNPAGDTACRVNTCVPATGACALADQPPLTPCDDGSACTGQDSCQDGACTGSALSCDDQDTCTDDSCDPATGCVFTPNESCGKATGGCSCDAGDSGSPGWLALVLLLYFAARMASSRFLASGAILKKGSRVLQG
jgi:MYXO-CTERM domain-containing protein